MDTGMIMRKKPVKGKTSVMPPKAQASGATFVTTKPATATSKTSVSMGAPQKKFIPGDFNSKRPIDRLTTPEIGKSLGENPAKTQARMSAQSQGKTSYDFGGKKEYSGRTETTRMPKITTEVSTTPARFKMVTSTPKDTQSYTAKKLPSSGTMMKKRRLPRVDYFQGKGYGRNKRTESGHGR